jgi:hypothetical protein
MINLSLFTATSGDYSTITNVITADDAIAFDSIYNAIKTHAELCKKPPDFEESFTLLDYVQGGINVALEGYSVAAIATLKAVGLITTSDNIHIAITALGYGFYEFIQE